MERHLAGYSSWGHKESDTTECTHIHMIYTIQGFPGGSDVKTLPEIQETLYNSGDAVSITGSGRSPGEGNDIPFSSILSWKIPWTEESAEL